MSHCLLISIQAIDRVVVDSVVCHHTSLHSATRRGPQHHREPQCRTRGRRGMRTRRRVTARTSTGNDDTASTFLSETSSSSETTVGESEHAIHPKRTTRSLPQDSQNGGVRDHRPCRSPLLVVIPVLLAVTQVTPPSPTTCLTYLLTVALATAFTWVVRKTFDVDCERATALTYNLAATCAGIILGSVFSSPTHGAATAMAPSSVAYITYSVLAWFATPTWGLSSSDHFFGSGSGSMYSVVISYYNMDTMGWNIIYHLYLVQSGRAHGVVFVVQIVSSIYHAVLAAAQTGSLSNEDAMNCKIMSVTVIMLTFIDMDRISYESSGFQFPRWTPSLIAHAAYLLPMYLFDPVRIMFDFVKSGESRGRLGLYKESTRHSMSWLVAHMTCEFVYMASNSLDEEDTAIDTAELIKQACKLGCIIRTAIFLFQCELQAGIVPRSMGYALACFAHGGIKIWTLTATYYSINRLDTSLLLYVSLLYTFVVLRIAPLCRD